LFIEDDEKESHILALLCSMIPDELFIKIPIILALYFLPYPLLLHSLFLPKEKALFKAIVAKESSK